MGISKITRNYQVTIPSDVREVKNFHVGDKVLFVIEQGRVELIKAGKSLIRESAGLWNKTKETGVDYENRVRRGWKKRHV